MSKSWNGNGLQPIYDEPEEEADESNEFLKRLKQAWFKTSEAVHGLITGHLWISW